jgi:putative ABC transport system permease protein
VGLARFGVKRQIYHPVLTLLALLGIVMSVAMVNNASIFSEAVDKVILDQALAEFSREKGRPAFSTAVYTYPSARAPMALEEAETTGQFAAHTLANEVGLPLDHVGYEIHSGSLMLRAREGSDLYSGAQASLGYVDLVYIAGVADHMTIVAGEPLDDGKSGEALEVWVHNYLAEKMGLHIGEELDVGLTLVSQPTPIRVAGFWQAADPDDRFWFTDPDYTFRETFLVRRQDYLTHLQPIVPAKVRAANWHIILDESKVIPADASEYVAGFGRALSIINRYLPDARLNTPPLDPLEDFVRRGTALATLLLAFNVPGFGFLLYFLILTSAIIVRWQQRETTILVSRGMGVSEVLVLTSIEELVLLAVGYPLGVVLGIVLARLMGYTTSFMSFASHPPLPVSLRGLNLPLTLIALAIALAARLLPAARTARESVVESEHEISRPQKAPFWYRSYLDVLLIFPTVYAYDQLAKQGTIALLVQDRAEDLYRDPLLILVPAFFVLAGGLLAMRLFSLITWIIDRLAGTIPWTSLYLALHQLGRQSRTYISPLLLVTIALALGVYTISMAASLDQWLVDRIYYGVGADLTFSPYLAEEGGSLTEAGDELTGGGSWIPLVHEFQDLPGVRAATRVGDYPLEVKLADRRDIRGRFLAIDRLDFPRAAWLRRDLANDSLGAMMNRLALYPDGVLISPDILAESQVQVGDKLHMQVTVHDDVELDTMFTVAGTYDYFPTVYPDESPAVIGNLDHLIALAGFPPAHQIWMGLETGATGTEVLRAMPTLGDFETARVRDAKALIAEQQAQMERVGVFGTLSVGFVAAALVAIFGLTVYTYASLRERLYRLTVLRAVGMTRRQVVTQVVLEYGLLLAYGSVLGAAIGIAASALFLPFFKVTGEAQMPIPPLLPMIAHGQIATLLAVFAGGMVVIEALVIARALARRNFELLRLLVG